MCGCIFGHWKCNFISHELVNEWGTIDDNLQEINKKISKTSKRLINRNF